MKRTQRQSVTAYTALGGVGMDDRGGTQQVEVLHTIPKMTVEERKEAEKRISNDLFEVLSDIYNKLQSESE